MRRKSDLRVIWSPLSKQDINDLGEYLIRFVPLPKAENVVSGILLAGNSLNEFPRLSRIRNDMHPDLRLALVRPHVICYLIKASNLHIVRVLHEKQDVAAALSEDPMSPML